MINNRPTLEASDDGGQTFIGVFNLNKEGRWITNSTMLCKHPEVFIDWKKMKDSPNERKFRFFIRS